MDERGATEYELGARGAGTKEAAGGQHHDPPQASSPGPFLAAPRRATSSTQSSSFLFFNWRTSRSPPVPPCGGGKGRVSNTLAQVNTGAATCLGLYRRNAAASSHVTAHAAASSCQSRRAVRSFATRHFPSHLPHTSSIRGSEGAAPRHAVQDVNTQTTRRHPRLRREGGRQ